MQPRRNWQDQRQRGQSAEHGERGDRALKLESLLEVSACAKDKAETHHAVENDHHRREHRVPGDALAALGPSEHDRDNEPGFDHRHRDREKDRAKRFAKLEREHLGVMDGGEHRRAEEETRENKDISIVGRDDMGQLQRQQSAREQRCSPGPGRNGGGARRRHRSIPLRGRPVCRRRATRAIRRAAAACVLTLHYREYYPECGNQRRIQQ